MKVAHYKEKAPHMVWRKCSACGFRVEFKAREDSWECPLCNERMFTEPRPRWEERSMKPPYRLQVKIDGVWETMIMLHPPGLVRRMDRILGDRVGHYPRRVIDADGMDVSRLIDAWESCP